MDDTSRCQEICEPLRDCLQRMMVYVEKRVEEPVHRHVHEEIWKCFKKVTVNIRNGILLL